MEWWSYNDLFNNKYLFNFISVIVLNMKGNTKIIISNAENYRSPIPKTHRSQWFHGTLDRQEAERTIKNYSDKNGTFLVRYSDRNKGQVVLTLLNESLFYHYIICKSVNLSVIQFYCYLIFSYCRTITFS